MRRTLFAALLILASCAVIIPATTIGVRSQTKSNGPVTATVAHVGDAVGAYCPGYSTAQIHLAIGTLSGATFTPYVASNTGTFAVPSPGPTGAPVNVTPSTLSGTGDMYVTLSSASYVYGVLTAVSSGSGSAYVTCTTAGGPPAPAGTSAANQNVTVTAPTDAAGNVKAHDAAPVQPSPLYTQPVNGSVSVSSLPPITPATTVPVQQVAAPSATTPVSGNVGMCNANGATPCIQPTASPNGAATPLNLMPVAPCDPGASVVACAGVTGRNLNVVQGAAPSATTPVNGNVGVCTSGGVAPCINPTASPNGGAVASNPLTPVQPCVNNAGSLLCQSMGAIPVPTAGQGIAAAAPYVVANNVCVNPAGGTPAPNAGNWVSQPAYTNGECKVANVMVGPSTAPAVAQNEYEATVTSGGVQSHQICSAAATPVCVAPTATPAISGGNTLGNVIPVVADLGCIINPTQSTPSAGTWVHLGCAYGTTGSILATGICTTPSSLVCWNALGNASDNNAGTNSNNGFYGNSINFGYNTGTGNYDRQRDAPSPAPSGIPASGYNDGGAAAFVLCKQMASQQTASTTAVVLVAAVGAANRIYPCEIDYTITAITAAVASATATIEYGTQTTNPCDTSTVIVKKVSFGSGSITSGILTLAQTMGNGTGIVGAPSATNSQMCIVVSSVDEQFDVNVTYAAMP